MRNEVVLAECLSKEIREPWPSARRTLKPASKAGPATALPPAAERRAYP
jgi:hypothetical protein